MKHRKVALVGTLATLVALAGLVGAEEAAGRGAGRKEHRGMGRGPGAMKGDMGARIEQRFKQMDADGDGKVTFEEFKAWHEQHMQELFKRLDRNGDGVLSPEDRIQGGEGPRIRDRGAPAAGDNV